MRAAGASSILQQDEGWRQGFRDDKQAIDGSGW
jgi:hypothetical protein